MRFVRMIAQRKIAKPVRRKLETEKYTIKGEIKRVQQRIQEAAQPLEFQSLFGIKSKQNNW